jgi:hypothetical protein
MVGSRAFDASRPVSQIICRADHRRAQASGDVLNFRLTLKSADELVHEVEDIRDVSGVSDAVDEVQERLARYAAEVT